MGRPPRLAGFRYIGLHAYFFTICTFNRHRCFADRGTATITRDHLLRTSADYQFELIAYCLMPDHVHALVEGTTEGADFIRFVSMFKQKSGHSYRQSIGSRLWQESFQEHTLRGDEDVEPIAAYIVGNPIRAGLCEEHRDYPFLGSSRYSLEQLRDAIQMSPISRRGRP